MSDDPELDGTPFAHPAYYRGSDHAVKTLCYMINRILDGKDKCHGACAEPWESTRRRLLALVQEENPNY